MSVESLHRILSIPGRTGVLTTLKRDGRPQMPVVIHRYDPASRTLSVSVTDDRAKTRNLRRDPRAGYLVAGASQWEYVVAEGTARLGEVATDPHDAAADDLVRPARPPRATASTSAAMADPRRLAHDPLSACYPSFDEEEGSRRRGVGGQGVRTISCWVARVIAT